MMRFFFMGDELFLTPLEKIQNSDESAIVLNEYGNKSDKQVMQNLNVGGWNE